MNYCQFRNDVIKRMAVTGGGGGLLPDEYQQVEYIKGVPRAGAGSSGTALAYINTNIPYFADFEIDTRIDGAFGGIFCGTTTNACVKRVSSAQPYYSLSDGSGNSYVTNISTQQRTKIKWKTNQLYIDDVFITNLEKTNVNGAFCLFSGGSGGDHYAYICMYKFTAWDNNGTPIRDMFPCYRKADGVVGMYDIINNVFYVNAQSGVWGWFITGNDVL